MILTWDTTGRILFLNEYGERFFGYSENELIGKNAIGTIVPEVETSGRDLQLLMQAIQLTPDQLKDNENENMTRDGRRVWVRWAIKAILDREGRLLYPENRQASPEDRRMFDLSLGLNRSQVHMFDHSSEHRMVELTTPVRGGDGGVLGLVLVAIHIDAINNKFLQPIKSGERGYAWMMDDKGTLIYHPTQPPAWRSWRGANRW